MSDTTLTPEVVTELTGRVYNAQTEATAIAKLTNDHPDMGIPDAYLVQNALRERFLADGARLVGWKAGLTSKAKMQQMGVDKPSVGFLTNAMSVLEGTTVPVSDHVHPRVEAEVAFVMAADLPVEGCTADDVVAATAYVVPAIEIIDSRYEAFKFDLPSVIADNSSSARFVVGANGRRLDEIGDRTTLGLTLVQNGQLMATGASAAVMGDPAEAVALVAQIVGSLGSQIKAGQIVLSGGITAAIPVQPGDHVSARFQELGVVDVNFS